MKKRTLVLGASLKADRYSNKAIKRIVNNGIEIKALGRVEGEVLGVEIETKPVLFKGIHTVTLYLNPNNQKPYYDYILKLQPQRVIFNPGTENIELMKKLKENNIKVEVACTLVLLSTKQY